MPTPTRTTDQQLTVVPVPAMGAEDVLVGPDGEVYTGTEDGAVLRVSSDGSRIRRVGSTGGRPLGLELLRDGRLLVCDALRGLLALDPGTGHVETIVEDVAGARMVFCNNAAVASDGSIYFSDSSRVHPIDRWKADVVEDTRSGRLIRVRPVGDGWASPEVLVTGLRFANGVALASDESFVCVAESAGRTLVRRWLTGVRRGQVDLLADDLPGYPDNISSGSDGLVWVTIASPPNAVLERFLPRGPRALRSLVWRLPDALQPKPEPMARVMAFDDSGGVVHDISCDAEEFFFVTGVREHQGRVWLGSLHQAAVAWFDL
jgi:sugar lactone lactonase YvrE